MYWAILRRQRESEWKFANTFLFWWECYAARTSFVSDSRRCATSTSHPRGEEQATLLTIMSHGRSIPPVSHVLVVALLESKWFDCALIYCKWVRHDCFKARTSTCNFVDSSYSTRWAPLKDSWKGNVITRRCDFTLICTVEFLVGRILEVFYILRMTHSAQLNRGV